MLEVLLVALAVGLGNFAASVGIGVAGVEARTRLRVGLVFGAFETLMPVVGLLVGRKIAGPIGSKASLLGGALLVGAGVYGVVQARRSQEPPSSGNLPTRKLLLVGAALSIDNLVVGFALGTSESSVLLTVLAIAIASISMSLLGLEVGSRLGTRVEQRSEEIGGAILVLVGVALMLSLF